MLFRQSRALLRHCCWCGRGFTSVMCWCIILLEGEHVSSNVADRWQQLLREQRMSLIVINTASWFQPQIQHEWGFQSRISTLQPRPLRTSLSCHLHVQRIILWVHRRAILNIVISEKQTRFYAPRTCPVAAGDAQDDLMFKNEFLNFSRHSGYILSFFLRILCTYLGFDGVIKK